MFKFDQNDPNSEDTGFSFRSVEQQFSRLVTWPFRSDTSVDTRSSILLHDFSTLGKIFSVRVGVMYWISMFGSSIHQMLILFLRASEVRTLEDEKPSAWCKTMCAIREHRGASARRIFHELDEVNRILLSDADDFRLHNQFCCNYTPTNSSHTNVKSQAWALRQDTSML